MPDLDGGNAPIPLGANYSIRAPGLTGTAELLPGRSLAAATRTRSRANELSGLDDALASQGMRDVATIDLSGLRSTTPPAGAAKLRAPSDDDALELETPDPGAGYDTVVLAVDEAGVVTWNFPLTETNAIEVPTSRGSGKKLHFRIPRKPVARPAGPAGERGLFGTIGRKLLKVLVYPITDRLVGAAVDYFAGEWEAEHRKYRVRRVTPANYTDPSVAPIALDDATTWRDLGSGRALLFLHGTFSTTHGAFGGLSLHEVRQLEQNYGGRLFAFDHFTLSHSPKKNAEEFVSRLPHDASLHVDIVCHSRGGLVARELVERSKALGPAGKRIQVHKVVFVGVPNGGTALTNPAHVVHMIDRLTSALNLFPDGPVTTILESIITAVKVIGHGGLKSLDGLASMNPKGTYLQGLAAQSAGRAAYFGVTSNFEPAGSPLAPLALANVAIDRVFGGAKNDLVVPTSGVFEENGSPCFPIPFKDVLELAPASRVLHTNYFSHPPVRQQLLAWLSGS